MPRLTYAITPPNLAAPPERRRQLASIWSERIRALPIDALLVYDVQDEGLRNAAPRPFPFAPKVDPLSYACEELHVGALPRVVYHSVAKGSPEALRQWTERLASYGGPRAGQEPTSVSAVFVGAPSSRAGTSHGLAQTYEWCFRHAPDVCFGGVVIPERHVTRGGEEVRVLTKFARGCRFFVSQTVWCVETTQRLLLDLVRRAQETGTPVPPIQISLSPCGSRETLEFLRWLGVFVPESVVRELRSAKDMLERSVDCSARVFEQLCAFAAPLGVALGCNVESVSTRATEVAASLELLARVAPLARQPLPAGVAFVQPNQPASEREGKRRAAEQDVRSLVARRTA